MYEISNSEMLPVVSFVATKNLECQFLVDLFLLDFVACFVSLVLLYSNYLRRVTWLLSAVSVCICRPLAPPDAQLTLKPVVSWSASG